MPTTTNARAMPTTSTEAADLLGLDPADADLLIQTIAAYHARYPHLATIHDARTWARNALRLAAAPGVSVQALHLVSRVAGP